MNQRMLSAALVLGLLGQVVSEDVDTVLASLNVQCRASVVNCRVDAKTSYNQVSYCDAITYKGDNFIFVHCMLGSGDCTLSDYFRVRNAACGINSTALDSTESFGIAVVSVSRQCRESLGKCTQRNAAAYGLLKSAKYCEVLQYSTSGFSLQSCMVVDSGCTQSEFDKVRQGACGANSLTVGAISLVLSSLILILKKL